MGSRKIKRRGKRIVKKNAGSTALFDRHLQMSRKFGQDAGSSDPILFHPDLLTPQPFRLDESLRESTEAMVEAGIRPEVVYAHRKTGLIVTEENVGKIPADALAEWRAAVEEYFEMNQAEP